MNSFARLLLATALVSMIFPTVSAFADDDDSHDSVTGLKFIMKDMGAQTGVLVSALIKHETVSASDLQTAADKLLADIKIAKGRLPDQLVDASGKPLPGKQTDIQQYSDLINQLTVVTTKLDAAIHSGDTALATTILTNDLAAVK